MALVATKEATSAGAAIKSSPNRNDERLFAAQAERAQSNFPRPGDLPGASSVAALLLSMEGAPLPRRCWPIFLFISLSLFFSEPPKKVEAEAHTYSCRRLFSSGASCVRTGDGSIKSGPHSVALPIMHHRWIDFGPLCFLLDSQKATCPTRSICCSKPAHEYSNLFHVSFTFREMLSCTKFRSVYFKWNMQMNG